MGRAFGIVLLLCALWAGLEIYTHGMGALTSQRLPARERALASSERGDSSGGAARGPITQRVRERVSADLAAGYERHTADAD